MFMQFISFFMHIIRVPYYATNRLQEKTGEEQFARTDTTWNHTLLKYVFPF